MKIPQGPITFNVKERIWSGPQRRSIYGTDISIGEIIFQNMKTWPQNVCQICDFDGKSVTFDQALTWAIRLAQFFKKKGLGHKDVIGIIAENSTLVMPLAVACLMNGTPFQTANPRHNEEVTSHVLSTTKPVLIFCDGNEYEKIRRVSMDWQPEIYIIVDPIEGVPSIESLLEPTSLEEFYQPEPLKEGASQTVAILCSSGTSAMPKSICIPNSRLMPEPDLDSTSVLFSRASLSWNTGLMMFVTSTLLGCTRVITRKPLSPDYLVHLIETYKISYLILTPNNVYDLVNCAAATPKSLASIRTLNSTGTQSCPTILQRCQELCRNGIVKNMYGMTESGVISLPGALTSGGSVGQPVSGIRIRIVDEHGVNQKHNQIGEIYVHTGQEWKGYYGNLKETRRMQDSDGWFHTGDLGYFDEQNSLFVVDRIKEGLNFKNRSYWPSQIESVILELRQVQNVCVVGIFNAQVGHEAGALVVRSSGATISEQEIVDYVAKRLPEEHKHLYAGVHFTDKLPINVNGKTMRREARDMFVALNASPNGKV